MITVHHLNQSRSKRVLWLLEELKIPYQIVTHHRDPQTHLAPDTLKAVHPLGKAPIIEDNQITLCESGAIMEYLLSKAANSTLRPQRNSANYYSYLEWLHFAEGSLALPVITQLFLNMESRNGQPLDHYIAKELALDLTYIETTLASHSYFAGDEFTAADIMMTIVLEFADNIKLLTDYPNIRTYLNKVQQRDAYRAIEHYG